MDIDNTESIEQEQAVSSLAHILGSKDETLQMLPDLSTGFQKDARRNFSEMEKWALIEEDGEAMNTRKLDIKGTHYETQSAAEIAMAILPLKGF